MLGAIKIALVLFLLSATATDICSGQNAGGNLQTYVDELPILPKIYGYVKTNGLTKPGNLRIGMYQIKWKFHRDLPASPVFVYGTSPSTATFPGPVIEAIQGVATSVTWENHLPDRHILPWDPTIPTAIPKTKGVPAVVHLHGGVNDPTVDGSAFAWFTADFKERGPKWTKSTYTYGNVQHPGNLWYHDHALGLTRENLLAGLLGPYVVRNPKIEDPFMLPSGSEFDRHLVIADRSFNTDGSIYMNKTGNVPTVHPQWQPEYFGDAMTVNGKAWPFSKVQKRKYRFRIINACNARYLQLRLSNGLPFTVIGSDTSYLSKPITTDTILVSPAEIYDVVVDFSTATTESVVELTNSAPYPYPNGTPPSLSISKVMRFELVPTPAGQYKRPDGSKVPSTLVNYPPPSVKEAKTKRYIVFFENVTSSGEPLNLHINGKTLEDPPTETPKSGSTEVWEVINLTGDNHPLHLHLAMFQPVKVQKLRNGTSFKSCMQRLNDAVECNIDDQVADGQILKIPDYEKTWKNVVKIEPDHMTTVVVKFNLVEGNAPYPFDATADPGFVYHCHILDHEDNHMIRPLILRA